LEAAGTSRSIGRRLTLTVIATTALAVALACAGFAAFRIQESRAELLASFTSLAELIGFNSMLPLVSGDASAVESALLALLSNDSIEGAAVYAGDRSRFARFVRDYERGPDLPNRAPHAGHRIDGDSLVVVREISAGGEVVGSVLVRASMEPLRSQLLETAGVAGGAFVLCLAPALIATTRLRRELAAPLAQLARGAERLSAGDLAASVSLARDDEIGVVGQAFDRMAAGLRHVMREVSASAHDVLTGARTLQDASRRVQQHSDTQRSSVARTSQAIERMEVSLEGVARATERLADATAGAAASTTQVQASTAQVAENMSELFALIEDTTSAIAESLESIREVGANAEHLDGASGRVANTIERLRDVIRSVEEAASHGLALAEQTAAEAQRGDRAVEETVSAMGSIDARFNALQAAIADLARRSTAIGEVVEVIEQVTAETNLLSLNASIVAAQAGEHGRTFGVVASQIGRLAERTASSSGEIAALVRAVQQSTRQAVQAATEGMESVGEGVKRSREAGEVLSSIIATSGEAAENVRRIALAAESQSAAVREVEVAFQGVRDGMSRIRIAVGEQRTAAGRVHDAMRRTSEVASLVQRATTEQTGAVGRIARAAEEIHEVTGEVREVTEAQSRDARQIIHALGLFGEIAARTGDEVRSVQKVTEKLGDRAEALEQVLGGLRLDAREVGS
jgi:methyl-accepting chemotaxis protein